MESLPRSRASAQTFDAIAQNAKCISEKPTPKTSGGVRRAPDRASEPGAQNARKPLREGRFGASLGTTAKSAVELEQSEGLIDPETGEISGLELPVDPMLFRVQRFALQSVVKGLMGSSRTAKCLRWRQKGATVQVWKSHEYRTASYTGLQTCGSVWACPVCASKVAERRRSEIIAAMTAHKAAGGGVFLLTLTAPHQRCDCIGDLLAKHGQALRRFWSLKAVR